MATDPLAQHFQTNPVSSLRRLQRLRQKDYSKKESIRLLMGFTIASTDANLLRAF
jgi:hypothetical protein